MSARHPLPYAMDQDAIDRATGHWWVVDANRDTVCGTDDKDTAAEIVAAVNAMQALLPEQEITPTRNEINPVPPTSASKEITQLQAVIAVAKEALEDIREDGPAGYKAGVADDALARIAEIEGALPAPPEPTT